MAEWKTPFKHGVSSFRGGKYDDAITSFSEALRLGGDSSTICDARAAVYQKMGKLKEALKDSKTVIDSQPSRWQGYARSARLFHQIRKFDAASRMVDLALERIPSDQVPRRNEMLTLRAEINSTCEEAAEEAARLASLRAYHFGKLPVEIANTTFTLLLAEDHAYVVVLAQVCKNWRSAILGMPAFWANLVLTDKHPARKIKAWKERSKNRIRALALTEDFSQIPSVLAELGKLSLKSLATLRLQDFPIRQLPAHIPSIGDQCLQALRGWHDGTATSLVGELRWHNNTPTFSPSTLDMTSNTRLRVDWAQLSDSLTDLQSCYFTNVLGRDDWPHILWLLHRNPNLVNLDIRQWHPSHAEPPPDRELPPIITLSQLSSLRITMSIPHRLMDVLAFPSLKTLDISSCPGTLNNTLQILADGKASALTSLAIRSATFDAQLMVRVLAKTPALESLQLSAIGGDAVKVVLEALARVQPPLPANAALPQHVSSPIYCPALRTLDCSQNQTVRGGELVRLVKLRIMEAEKSAAVDAEEPAQTSIDVTPVQPLQTLIADGCPMLDSDVLPWLREKVPSVSCVYMTKKAAGWKR